MSQPGQSSSTKNVTNPVLRSLPMPIKTNRLEIRPAIPGEGKKINAAIVASHPELRQWMPWAIDLPTIEDSEERIRKNQAEWILRSNLNLSIFLNGAYLGGTGYHRLDWQVPCFEIGYWVRSDMVGQGVVTETVSALTSYAIRELGARRLEIRCDALNKSSSNVARRCGFELEACLRRQALKPGTDELRDTEVYVRFDDLGLPDVGVSW